MKKKIKTIIVDDERYSREELKHLLSSYDAIDVVAEADSGETALIKVLQLKPDVLFLDIEMPKMNGLETAKAIKELKHQPLIVFATAYPSFAVDAFRYEAIDYILKPFEEERLNETITRIENRLNITLVQQESSPSKLAIESEDGIIYISPNDILYLYRDDRIIKIVGRGFQYETKTSLKELEIRLKDYSFFRIHKSYLVNLKDVSRLIPWFNGAYQLELKGHQQLLSVSRNYVRALREQLEL